MIAKRFRLYVAGPMRGKPGRNYPAFDAAVRMLESRGHVAINPADRARYRLGVWSDEDLDEEKLRAALLADFYDLLGCDGIVLLDGWEHSEGAKAEELIARLTGKRRFRVGGSVFAAFLETVSEDSGVPRRVSASNPLRHERSPWCAPGQEHDARYCGPDRDK